MVSFTLRQVTESRKFPRNRLTMFETVFLLVLCVNFEINSCHANFCTSISVFRASALAWLHVSLVLVVFDFRYFFLAFSRVLIT